MRSSKRKTDLGIFCTLFWTLLDLTELLTLAGSHLPPFSLKSQGRKEDAKAQLRRVIDAASGFQTRDPFAFIGPKKAKRALFSLVWSSQANRNARVSPARKSSRRSLLRRKRSERRPIQRIMFLSERDLCEISPSGCRSAADSAVRQYVKERNSNWAIRPVELGRVNANRASQKNKPAYSNLLESDKRL